MLGRELELADRLVEEPHLAVGDAEIEMGVVVLGRERLGDPLLEPFDDLLERRLLAREQTPCRRPPPSTAPPRARPRDRRSPPRRRTDRPRPRRASIGGGLRRLRSARRRVVEPGELVFDASSSRVEERHRGTLRRGRRAAKAAGSEAAVSGAGAACAATGRAGRPAGPAGGFALAVAASPSTSAARSAWPLSVDAFGSTGAFFCDRPASSSSRRRDRVLLRLLRLRGRPTADRSRTGSRPSPASGRSVSQASAAPRATPRPAARDAGRDERAVELPLVDQSAAWRAKARRRASAPRPGSCATGRAPSRARPCLRKTSASASRSAKRRAPTAAATGSGGGTRRAPRPRRARAPRAGSAAEPQEAPPSPRPAAAARFRSSVDLGGGSVDRRRNRRRLARASGTAGGAGSGAATAGISSSSSSDGSGSNAQSMSERSCSSAAGSTRLAAGGGAAGAAAPAAQAPRLLFAFDLEHELELRVVRSGGQPGFDAGAVACAGDTGGASRCWPRAAARSPAGKSSSISSSRNSGRGAFGSRLGSGARRLLPRGGTVRAAPAGPARRPTP